MKNMLLRNKRRAVLAVFLIIILVPIIMYINKGEKNKKHPVIRYRDNAVSSKNKTKSGPDSDESSITDDSASIDGKGSVGNISVKAPNTNFDIRFISYEKIDEKDLINTAKYLKEDFILNEFPSVEYQKIIFDAASAAKESEVMNTLFGEDSQKLSYEEWLLIYENNAEEVDKYRERHIIHYHPPTDYYFIKCQITNTVDPNVGEQYDKDGNMLFHDIFSANVISIVMSDGKGSYYVSSEPIYLYNNEHTDDTRQKDFFKVKLAPGESKEVIIGIPVAYDTYQYPDLLTEESYNAYVGFLDLNLMDEGVDPSLSPDMVSMDSIKYGN